MSLAVCTCGARFRAESRREADAALDRHVDLVHGKMQMPGWFPVAEHRGVLRRAGAHRMLDTDYGGR